MRFLPFGACSSAVSGIVRWHRRLGTSQCLPVLETGALSELHLRIAARPPSLFLQDEFKTIFRSSCARIRRFLRLGSITAWEKGKEGRNQWTALEGEPQPFIWWEKMESNHPRFPGRFTVCSATTYGLFSHNGDACRIRTHGAFTLNGFQDRHHKPYSVNASYDSLRVRI